MAWPVAHQNFNYWHSSARMMVEQAFGILKSRFEILRHGRYPPEEMGRIFMACVTIHNLAIDSNDTWEHGEEDPEEEEEPAEGDADGGDDLHVDGPPGQWFLFKNQIAMQMRSRPQVGREYLI